MVDGAHADFLAGWALAQQLSKNKPPAPPPGGMPTLPPILSVFLQIYGNQSAVQTMYDKGDTAFEDPDHHGTSKQRAELVVAGYNAKDLTLRDAFEKGLVLSRSVPLHQ